MKRMKEADQRHNAAEAASFRRWCMSLTVEELRTALQFPFEQQNGSSRKDRNPEFDLMLEMVRLEPPPPTPVHPRAMGYTARMSENRCGLDFPHGDFVRRRTQPRLFQWFNRSHSFLSTKPRIDKDIENYDVIARRKIAPWGEVYSLGCTREQVDCDRRLVDQSFVRKHVGQDPILTLQGRWSKRVLFRVLHVASRGHFFTSLPNASSNFQPWLQPTERWFSLSFYLSSRYQLSLWKIFKTSPKIELAPEIEHQKQLLARVLPLAFGAAIKRTIAQDAQAIARLRDSFMWSILIDQEPNSVRSRGGKGGWDNSIERSRDIPLLLLISPWGKFQMIVNQEVDTLLREEIQRTLLEDDQKSTKVHMSIAPPKSRRKKKAKKRKKRGRRIPMSIPEQSESDDETNEPRSISTSEIRFPDNGTFPRDRNKHIILALTIIEEAIEAAFLEVGMEPSLEDNRISPTSGLDDGTAASNSEIPREELIEEAESDKKNVEDQSATARHHGLFPRSPFSPNHEPNTPWPPIEAPSLSAFEAFVPLNRNTSENDYYNGMASNEESFARDSAEDQLDGWSFYNHYQLREQSILSDFFRLQGSGRTGDVVEDEENLMVASTAASISSSTYKDSTILAETDEVEKEIIDQDSDTHVKITSEDDQSRGSVVDSVPVVVPSETAEAFEALSVRSNELSDDHSGEPLSNEDDLIKDADGLSREIANEASMEAPRSPSPQAPLTPPPTLSPILVSLADLRDLKSRLSLTPPRLSKSTSATKARSFSAVAASGSLPSSPTPGQENTLNLSWSRDDLRIPSFRDDQRIKPRRRIPQSQRSVSESQPSYRAIAVKSLAKPIASSKAVSHDFRSQVFSQVRRDSVRDSSARSETAVEGRSEDQHWHHEFRRSEDFDGKSVTKDETTTIMSALSNREPEEVAILREERNTYRDMCLTLGAEVAKLRVMLSAQQAVPLTVPVDYQDGYNTSLYRPSSFDPHGMRPFFHGIKRGQRLGPMSDAGGHRGGDYESQISEDDGFETIPKARVEMMRQMSSSATIAGSDVSVDFNNSNSALQSGPMSVMPVYDSVPPHGLQSRLTEDIIRFLNSTTLQLKNQGGRRRTAVDRFGSLVTAIWPRAQVKLYGSHVSGLCLPSSDLDFVVCLPAVHKKAPALAPGVLEGRNAINESSQKVLARELKGESWIDPRSIKLIERTVVPVIKVSTKDSRARVLQLDISFDSPEHHGLEANAMVTLIMEDLPLIRPLVLILKQFLLDRGLLTAYTGGVSSYCLFLMVARYLQEQPRSVGDCGSLLMGFLDFFGNHFDPRTTGISVRRRQYFSRSNNYPAGTFPTVEQAPIWTAPMQHTPQHINVPSPVSAGPHDFSRRNSFSSDTGSVDGGRRGHRPPRFQASPASSHRYISPNKVPIPVVNTTDNSFGHGRPFTFDPLFVEDPLSSGNNVGRNAFRIFSVQRAFSDAHRTLVASLEWDIHESGELNDGVEYPLLKCLLQSEDVFYQH